MMPPAGGARWLRPVCGAALALATLASGARPALAESPAALLRCVQARYGALRDLAATFVQESRVVSLGRPRSRAGRLFLQPPGRMRWEYDPPDAQLIVADGRQFWLYRPERKQAVVQPMDAALSRQTPFLFLLGKGDFATEFSWEERDVPAGPGGAVTVALRPRVESADLARLTLEIVPGECRLAGTLVEDAYGNLTRLTFAAERANAGLDPAQFRFAPPAGTEIVKP
ncbi:MAG TPA: outer membrane lipoprotein carrier protein LolA [Candidatus Methanoperedens sp.]|nr:outer membrane lipoprotein carrier protein LolA [Candidatus Methanoperedens sp.]